MRNLKFKRTIGGEYTATYEGYDVEISKNFETRNWSLTIFDSNTGAVKFSDTAITYASAKEYANDVVEDVEYYKNY